MNFPNAYSGGRYHAFVLAIAASTYHQVYFITNVIPIFANEFGQIESYKNLKIIVTPDYDFQDDKIDVAIVIPDLNNSSEWFYNFYLKILHTAYKNSAKVILLNFETPNWFNEISPYKRDEKLWKWWLKTAFFSHAILSSAQISKQYAQRYFDYKHLQFFYAYPAINQIAADKYKNKIVKKDEVILFARFFDAHKGSFNLLDILSDNLSGYAIKIVVGNGKVPVDFKKQLQDKADRYKITVKYLYKISDEEKFKEIASSKLLLFLSEFEGFGYPPVEALYMGVPVVAKYLDVLYEVSGDNITYIKDIQEFQNLDLKQIMQKKVTYNKDIEIEQFAKNLNSIFNEVVKNATFSQYKKIKLFLIVKCLEWLTTIKKLPFKIYFAINKEKKLKILQTSDEVLIFGIGEYSKVWTQWCKENDKKILGYIVQKADTKTHLGKPVSSLSEIYKFNKNIPVILSTISKYSAFDILDLLAYFNTKYIYFCENTPSFKVQLTMDKIIQDSLKLFFYKNLKKLLPQIFF